MIIIKKLFYIKNQYRKLLKYYLSIKLNIQNNYDEK